MQPHLLLDRLSLDIPVYQVRHLTPDGSSNPRLSEVRGVGLVSHVLREVSLSLEPGTRLALMGRNGSGKTMLMRTLAGALPPSRGTRSVTGRLVSMLDSGFGLYPTLRGNDNIRILARFHGHGRREIARILEDVAETSELGTFLQMPVSAYSSGMVMRLGFAISMAVRPKIVLLDEWFFTADEAFLAKARARLEAELGSDGILVMSTHASAIAESWCTRAVLMADGRIVKDGPPDEVLTAYRA